MSKEPSPLEAFERLKNKPTLSTDWDKRKTAYDYNKLEYDIIEAALKDYNKLEETNILLVLREQINTKKLEALKIIKEKNVDIRGIKETKNVHEYNVKFTTTLNEFLEEQEYELLKEVLL